MDGYQQLYPHAAHAWRTWQGTLSGKAGVTFQDKSCGAPMGEKGYGDLKNKVGTAPPLSLHRTRPTRLTRLNTVEPCVQQSTQQGPLEGAAAAAE